jgi:signal transduction histidine kinase
MQDLDELTDERGRKRMPSHTYFLPVERLSLPEVAAQAEQVVDSPTLIAMLDTAPGMVALLNPERQIVFCNEACAKAGGLARKEDAVGMRPGELLRCIRVAEGPGGCGTAEACRYCGLAQAQVAGQQGRADSGECLLQCEGQDRSVAAEYAIEVRPLTQLGPGWQCYSLSDVSATRRREALQHIFFHDIMNRASAVQGVSYLLADEGVSPEEHARFIGTLSASAQAMVEEIGSQRILLAAEKGELAVESAGCDSLQALRDAANACQAFGVAGNKQVAILPAARSVVFKTDGTLLGRVLINLLKNALEASAAGMIVTAACTVPAAGRIRFSVHNDTAMPAPVRAHVFQRSFSTKGPGRGLGTYSVRLLTESYLKGRAWFESAEGLGTTFHAEFAA